jgi:hypothetical protein
MASAPNKPALIEEASRRITELLRKTMVSSSIMGSALEIPTFSHMIKDKVFSDHFSGSSGLRTFIEDVKLLQPIDPEKPGDPEKSFEIIARTLAEQTAVNGEMVIAAAVIVLSHSTADDVFTGACDLAIRLDSAKWIPELNLERKVSLKTLREKGTNAIFGMELERFRKQLAGKSLPSRAELFFRHVPIHHNPLYSSTDPQHFRLSVLKEADDLRISIVHGRALPKIDLKQCRKTMLFLHEAAITALRSLGFLYPLRLDPGAFAKHEN